MSIASLDKPAGTPCRHLSATGCTIHARRFPICRGFHCLWLRDTRGLLGDEHRPDRVGLILTSSRPAPGRELAIVAREVVPGAADRPAGRALIGYLRRFSPVHIGRAQAPLPVTLTMDVSKRSRMPALVHTIGADERRRREEDRSALPLPGRPVS